MREGITKRLRLSQLYNTYASLLTEKQSRCMKLYFDEDMSLSEVARELGVTRQAVFDLLKRVEQRLEKYEAGLGVVKDDVGRMKADG